MNNLNTLKYIVPKPVRGPMSPCKHLTVSFNLHFEKNMQRYAKIDVLG